MSENKKLILKIGIPAAVFILTVSLFGAALFRRNRTIRNLRSQMEARGIPVSDSSEPEKVYEPTTVDHHYDRLGYKIYLSDDTFGQIWLPVLSDVPLSDHPTENMVEQPDGRVLSFDRNGGDRFEFAVLFAAFQQLIVSAGGDSAGRDLRLQSGDVRTGEQQMGMFRRGHGDGGKQQDQKISHSHLGRVQI